MRPVRSSQNVLARSLRGAGLAASNRLALEVAGELVAVLEEHDRRVRTAKLHAGLEAKRRQADGVWHQGPAPYGWRSAGAGRLVSFRREQLVCEWIFRQREQGYGWENITERLNEAGTPGPRGGRWNSSTVRRIVARGRSWRPAAAVELQ